MLAARARIRARTVTLRARRRFCSPQRAAPTLRSPSVSASRASRSRSGESVSSIRDSTAWRSSPGLVVRGLFPPVQIAEVKALACELPAEKDVPLSRWSAAELAREAVARGIVESISGVTVWRWLSADAIRPWNYRSWIFPRDPQFKQKAGPILDLYEGRWEGQLLEPGDYVVCADEKPSIQARARIHQSAAPTPGGEGQLVEHEYERGGALCYLAAWDARRARIFDRCAEKDGIEPFDTLVEQFMAVEPYRNAQRVFLIIDNGSAHRGKRSINRLQGAWPNMIVVHTPVHASWLNQCEIYFSIAQRKALQPNNFTDLDHSNVTSWRSDDATSRSPSRSNGSSPAETSTWCSTGSTRRRPRRSRPSKPRDPPIRQDNQNVKELPRQRSGLQRARPSTAAYLRRGH